MKKILSLDVGITTGYAVHWLSPFSLITSGNVDAGPLRHTLQDILLTYLPAHSVAERPVIIRGKLGDQLEQVMSTIRIVFDHQVEFVDPSAWKQTPFSKSPVPRGLTQHERDAIRLGAWYCDALKKRLQGQ